MLLSCLGLVSGILAANVTITFRADYSFALSQPLIEGDQVTVVYDMARAKCDHAYVYGTDTQTVTGFRAVNRNFNSTATDIISQAPSVGAPLVYHTPTFTAVAGVYDFWFLCSSEANSVYDSNQGANWVVTAAPAKTIAFHADFTTTVSGPLAKGDTVRVVYDLARADEKRCPRYATHGAETFGVTLYWALNNQFTSDNHATRIVYTPSPGSPQVYTTPLISLDQPGDLQLWFVCGSEAGGSWDSNFGSNYHFHISA
ncbi:hypothetical protein HDV03_000465 [Kappamyces sp. JEL0829]|nr:hypothetical protein HDV03_000465 [Kappamyces sp. JEL0829]